MDSRERFAETQVALESALSNLQTRLWTALPGEVDSYDPKANTVEVQPTVKGLVTSSDGNTEPVDLPILPDVPVFFPRGGGVTLTFPIQKGDECIVVFSSRCIDGWWQNGGSQLAPEFRMHDLSDGFAFIGPMSQPNVIPDIETNVAQLRTDDGKAYLQMNPTTYDVDLLTPGNATATVDKNVTATVKGNVDAQITGTMTGSAASWHITGDITVNGSITTTGDVVAAGVSLDNHTHTGNDGSPTSPPN